MNVCLLVIFTHPSIVTTAFKRAYQKSALDVSAVTEVGDGLRVAFEHDRLLCPGCLHTEQVCCLLGTPNIFALAEAAAKLQCHDD